ncbi:Potassium voltage-gated channel subfamily KQT member [Dirofilaria immitis]
MELGNLGKRIHQFFPWKPQLTNINSSGPDEGNQCGASVHQQVFFKQPVVQLVLLLKTSFRMKGGKSASNCSNR